MDAERNCVQNEILKYLTSTTINRCLLNEIKKFCYNINNKLIQEYEMFNFSIFIKLNDISVFLHHLLLTEPFLVQKNIKNIILLLLKKYVRDINKFHLSQIHCPIIIDPVILPRLYKSPGISVTQGVLIKKSENEKYLITSTWKCSSEDCKFYKVLKKLPPIAPFCEICAVPMKELLQNRKYREYFWAKFCKFPFNNCTQNDTVKIKYDHVIGNLQFELGAEYILTIVRKRNYLESWGCVLIDKIPLPLQNETEIMKLRKRHETNPWGFVRELAERITRNTSPPDHFMNIKLGLLLSLASTKTDCPIPIVVICDNSNICGNLMIATIKYSERNFISQHSSNLNGYYHEKCLNAGSLHLSRGGICYLNDWNLYNNKNKTIIANVMESKEIKSNNAFSFNNEPLKCAVWAYVEKPSKKKEMEHVLTLFKIFGLVWRLNVLPENEEELIDFVLNDKDNDKKENPAFQSEVINYLNYVNSKTTDISNEALNVLQQYFISVRKIRGSELPLTSLDPLQALTEAHGRLNERSTATIEDALVAMQLCEENLGSTPLIENPPKDMTLFKLWLKKHNMISY